jgi:hypothetical protein
MVSGLHFSFVGEFLYNIIGIMLVIEFSLVIDLNEFWVFLSMMSLVFLMMVLHLGIVTLMILMEPCGVVAIWGKLGIVIFLVVIANSRHVLWRIGHIWVIGSLIIVMSHVAVDFIILKLLLLVFTNDFSVVVVRTSLDKCISCWWAHDFSG